MSTAFYPQGMKKYNNHLPQGGFISWKNKFPTGITSTHLRPLTNKDPANWYPASFGKPRPLKQYRKGNSSGMNDVGRVVRSSMSQSLEGGLGPIGQLQGVPGNYQVNSETKVNCENCNGLKIVDNYKPQTTFLTENPEPLITETKELCCNAEKKALENVIYASQNCQNANYYPNYIQYLQNKCSTYEQKAFGFVKPVVFGSAEYVTNCQPYGENNCDSVLISNFETNTYSIKSQSSISSDCGSCKVAIYKPSNKVFAIQGPARSSTRTAKLTAETLESNYKMIYRDKTFVYTKENCDADNGCSRYTNIE
jgi:hypothetical protein